MPQTIAIRLTGHQLPGQPKPALMGSMSRSGTTPVSDDAFLPAAYVQVEAAYDLSLAARSATGSESLERSVEQDQVLVIELSDGSTLVTSAARLKSALERNRPDLIGADGAILFDRLRAEAPAARGFVSDTVGGLVSKVFTLSVGAGEQDEIINQARDKLAQLLGKKLEDKLELGISWLGTKALMWAIEHKLDRPAGRLYHWAGANAGASTGALAQAAELAAQAEQPMLVFIHGTGSSTLGSFGDLQRTDRGLWAALERAYPGGIYGFEHRTLSESPIENALQLAEALPAGARVSLVTHSRGGLVGDLLCLNDIESHVANYSYAFKEGVGTVEPAGSDSTQARKQEASRVSEELAAQHAQQREHLACLARLLRTKALVLQRYVRVASPAQGTKLASGNFDLFLSGLLSLIGNVPAFFGNPLYSAFKRVVIEIAKNRTNPHLVPGIEAMLPDSPMAALLRDGAVQPGIRMALVAGDIEGGNLLQRIGVMLTDFLLFDNVDHDLVVDTQAMLGGIAVKANARVLFDRGAGVSHFRYFSNLDTRAALRGWLSDERPESGSGFQPLPARFDGLDAMGVAARRSATRTDLPLVVVLPGVMGSYLQVNGKDRVWFDPLDIAAGGLARIGWGQAGVEAAGLFKMSYGAICEHLAASHRVETFAYDWRQPLDVLGERLGQFLQALLDQTQQPIRLLAHSMGGLVVRACIHQHRPVMDALMQRAGARLVMLGTPHQGAYSMVENLLGKGDTLRTLVRLDLKHDMQEVLDIVSGFRGALQLLPKRGFMDTFEGDPDGGEAYALRPYDTARTWAAMRTQNTDLWFGDGRCGQPTQEVLDAACWLWKQDTEAKPALPAEYAAKSVYVFGVARNTACGVRLHKEATPPRLRMVGTARGDGTVTWDSGRIGNIGAYFYMPGVVHGDLLSTRQHFGAIEDLLSSGGTMALPTTPPALRAIEQAKPVLYDPAPPAAIDPASLASSLLGGSAVPRLAPRARSRLAVNVRAMDLRFINQPLMVGHYEQDPIAGPEHLLDTELLDGELGQRQQLGLYAGPLGTVTVVLKTGPAGQRTTGHFLGAVVTGLGPYDGTLGSDKLTLAVRTGVLRYLLQIVDVLGTDRRELSLSTLLLGYNSAANLSVAASLEALVTGVVEANTRFRATTGRAIRVARLDIVELYLDTAITVVYELRQAADKLADYAARHDTLLVCGTELLQGEGWRHRLHERANANYWPRLIVTDADQQEGEGAAPAARAQPTPGSEPACVADNAPTVKLANRLRFLYVGQRARAESIVQQRQPALVETLVRQQIGSSVWSADFGRMLFQLVVPQDFKQAARDLQRVVMVVDSASANLPWELMLADPLERSGGPGDSDGAPLAIRVPVVRQLTSTAFRRDVRHSLTPAALVIGNPSVDGFARHFPDPSNPRQLEPTALPEAEVEAKAVLDLLKRFGYDVKKAIGADNAASAVLAKLFQRPYRILHVSAHGVFDQCHRDGTRRSGIVLSDGLLITAAEINAMESVPELVFLNCCHLGQIDATVRGGNKLAASIARELIDIGVRCVVVAGWAVDDRLARLFGQTFYEGLLNQSLPFGDAVAEARKAAWNENPRDITWGAFQAYGDPAWVAEPQGKGESRSGAAPAHFVSPEELLDELARLRTESTRKPELQSESAHKDRIQALRSLLEQRCPAAWKTLPGVLSAIGATWRDLGCSEDARDAFLAAIQAEDRLGRVPIRDIEQLANIEARLGEKQACQQIATARAAGGAIPGPDGSQLIDRAIARLDTLGRLVASGNPGQAQPGAVVHPERLALLGSAYKRKASVYARQLQAMRAKDTHRSAARKQLREALGESVKAYALAAGLVQSGRFSPYNALNQLALEAVQAGFADGPRRDAAVDLARHCGAVVRRLFADSTDPWHAVMQPEAVLVEHLCSGALGERAGAGDAALETVRQCYEESVSKLIVKPWQLDSVVTQFELLAVFSDALRSGRGEEDAARRRIATRLRALARLLQPARAGRADEPQAAETDAAVKAAAPPAGFQPDTTQ